MHRLPTLDEVRAARTTIAGIAIRTPLLRLPDTQIYLKLENLQPIGSFKIRGAANAMAHIPREELRQGVVTASAGNMAQGVAWCARGLGIPCTVIAPDRAPQTKIRAIERLGATAKIVTYEEWWRAFEQRTHPGVEGRFIHAFDDPDVMAGNGTIGLEIIEELTDVDAVVIPWGGGGLTCGVASTVKALRPECRIYTAEVETAAPMAASFRAGSPQVVECLPSFIDGIGAKSVFPQMFERARSLVDGTLVTTVDEVAAAIVRVAERVRVIAEGAGATPIACALSGQAGSGKVVCIVSGGNIDASKLAALLDGKH